MLRVAFLLVFTACGRKTQVAGVNVAYTLRGSITLSNPTTSGVTDSQFSGGNISILLFASGGAGYCLEGADALAAEGPNQVAPPNIVALKHGGIGYELQVLEVPGQKYPLTVYPEAVMLNTDSFNIACVAAASGGAALYAARGYFGVNDQSQIPAENQSACCGVVASPLTIAAQGASVSVNFVLAPAPTPATGCTPPDAAFDRCTLRHSASGTDSACWTALGEEGGKLITQQNGQPCP